MTYEYKEMYISFCSEAARILLPIMWIRMGCVIELTRKHLYFSIFFHSHHIRSFFFILILFVENLFFDLYIYKKKLIYTEGCIWYCSLAVFTHRVYCAKNPDL